MFVEINSQRFPLDSGQIYMLGKQLSTARTDGKTCINLEDKDDVDQKHCVLEVGVTDDVYIFDLLSSKGTYLNNKRLNALEKMQLKNGDILKVGMQQVKFYHEQQEMSHDSSGFLEANKNTSDIIVSSPESTSQREIRMKRLDNNNFLLPIVPSQKLKTPNTSLFIPETEVNTSKSSLNNSLKSRRSDSFTIPETQFCKSRGSINVLDISVAESNPDEYISKNQFNLNLGDGNHDDDFCIPETQEAMTEAISCSQRPRLLTAENKSNEDILEEKTVDLEEGDDLFGGSQFRIATQDYNDGFGEEENECLKSQIIPLVKHFPVFLNNSHKSTEQGSKDQSKSSNEDDKEMSAIKWCTSNINEETSDIRGDCSTPDIFDFDNIRDVSKSNKPDEQAATNIHDTNKTHLEPEPPVLEDEEDLMPTQVFPSNNPKAYTAKRDMNEKEQPCLEKENEDFLTLSDKENRLPGDLEPITNFPPTQPFAINEVSSVISSASTSSRKSNASKSEANLNLNPSTSTSAQHNNSKTLLNLDLGDEDDLLTQAFLQPIKRPSSTTANANNLPPAKCFNSTLLDDKVVSKNPASFFAEMEKTPLKLTSRANAFKMPEKEFTSLRKTSSATSGNSESDLDLLMCTPQLIAEHIQVSKNESFQKTILAVKNKSLFGDDTDEEEDDGKNKEKNLVELINVPKYSKDFDKLLPHLKNSNENHAKRNNTITEEQKAAKEDYKKYKFNKTFGHAQEENKSKNTSDKSEILSRDERHAARDKERELDQQKPTEDKTQRKRKQLTRKAKADEEDQVPNKQERPTRTRKRLQPSEKSQKIKDQETKKSKETKNDETKKAKETKDTKDIAAPEAKEMPPRRMTRLKSRLEDKPSTSKEASANEQKNTIEDIDDLDTILTQPFVRTTRSRSSSKHSESQDGIYLNGTSRNKANKGAVQTSSKNSSSTNGSVMKNNIETKRKADTTTQHVTSERKRLRSTNSQEVSTTYSTSSTPSPRVISMTMVEPELFKELTKNSAGLWYVGKNPAESEVLVMDKAYRTFKFLLAMARGIPIVTSKWLKKINESKSINKAAISDYIFSDTVFEKKHKFTLIKSLNQANKQRLFEGFEFVMTSGILPNTAEMKAIIEAAGGCVHIKAPPPARDNQKIFLISSVNDKKDWHKFRRLNANIVIISTEAIMSAVMRQSCLPLSNHNNILA